MFRHGLSKSLALYSLGLLLIGGLFSQPASAANSPTVVLLSSIETPKIWYKDPNWNIQDDIEKTFRKSFDASGFRVVVQRDANAWDLRQALQAPENIGIFWVSHSANTRTGNGIFEASSIIADVHHADVKEIFQSVQPGLRYLAVIGCQAQGPIDEYKSQDFYRKNPLLQIGSFKTKIDVLPGLIFQLNQSVNVLGDVRKSRTYHDYEMPSLDQREPDKTKDYYEIPKIVAKPELLNPVNSPQANPVASRKMRITRRVPTQVQDPNSLLPIKILMGDRLIAVLPPASLGEQSVKEIDVPLDAFDQSNADQISVDTGLTAIDRKPLELGSFEFLASGIAGHWVLFADDNGKPIGVNGYLYNYESLKNQSQKQNQKKKK